MITIENLHVGDVVRFIDDIPNGLFDIDNASDFADGVYIISEIFEDDGNGNFTIEDDEDEWFWDASVVSKIIRSANSGR